MSARAASRLETLGFRHVHRYQPGRADWFAAGLPREGREAHTPRAADIAQRDVPTCRIDETVGGVRERIQAAGAHVCVVVDDQRVVLGLIDAEGLGSERNGPAERVMDPSPITFRPNLPAGTLPEYIKTPQSRALVTTSDGVLIGLLRLDDAKAHGAGAASSRPRGA